MKIFLNIIPIIIMVGLIPIIKNDFWLTAIYIAIIAVALIVYYEKRDYLFLLFGFIVILISEFFFIKTGVEKFERNSLFGIMPLWLPFLWSYAFVAIKRVINIFNNYGKPGN